MNFLSTVIEINRRYTRCRGVKLLRRFMLVYILIANVTRFVFWAFRRRQKCRVATDGVKRKLFHKSSFIYYERALRSFGVYTDMTFWKFLFSTCLLNDPVLCPTPHLPLPPSPTTSFNPMLPNRQTHPSQELCLSFDSSSYYTHQPARITIAK